MGARVRHGRVVALAGALILLAGCSRFGEETIRIDAAEEEIVALTDELAAELELDVLRREPLGTRSRCELLTGDLGASNRVGVRAGLSDLEDPLARASAVLSEAGYELRPGASGAEAFGSRDGIRVTVVVDEPAGLLDIDAVTGCRPQ
ncbi:MAG: hypothetical protein WD638_11235 [Nitriliruptoraceae bacterium]